MKVTIDSFRHHASYTVDVKRGSITLISGQSGIGKSTIFRAVQWCLYGKLHHYTPILKPRARTTVTIAYSPSSEEAWEIMRQGHPNLFRITIGEGVYSGTDAEALVSEHFGSEDVFLSCCYLEQMNRNHLLSLPQTERLKVLHHLSFSNTSPEEIKKAIASAISETKKEFEALKIRQSASGTELERFSPLIGDEEKANAIYNLSREGIESDISTITSRIKELEVQQRKREQALALKREYEEKQATFAQQLRKLEAKLREYPPEDVLEGRVESLKKKQEAREQEAKRKIEHEIHLGERRRIEKEAKEMELKMEQMWNAFHNVLEDNPQPARENIDTWTINPKHTKEALADAQTYSQQTRNAKLAIEKHGGQSRDDSIEAFIAELNNILDLQEYLEAETGIASLDGNLKTVSKLTEEKESILYAIRTKNTYKCPHCAHSFAIEYGVPVAIDPKRSERKGDLVALSKELETIDGTIHALKLKEKERGMYEIMLERFPPDYRDKVPKGMAPMSLEDKCRVKDLLETLERFPIIDKPEYTAEEIHRSLTRAWYQDKYRSARQTYQDKLKMLELIPTSTFQPISLESILPEETRAANELKELHQLQGRHKELKKQLQAILDSIRSFILPPDLSSELSKARLSKEELQSLLKQKEIVDKVAELESEIDERDSQMDILIDRYKELNTIMEVAKQVEHETLTSVVEGINENLAIIGGRLFDTPISLQLKLDRELKTRAGTKPDVNISITYQGAEYKLNQLSGGEQDRVSLALLLALSQLSSVGFLLLDEASAYLDQEYRERVVDVLRTFCGDKCVLSIEHEAVSGLYDKEIVLEG